MFEIFRCSSFLLVLITILLSPGLFAGEAPPSPGSEGKRKPSTVDSDFNGALGGGSAGATYFVDIDNEDNAGSGNPDGDMGGANPLVIFDDNPVHPIEFNINVFGPLPLSSAELVIEAFDVDETGGQVDQVLFNETPVGFLTGANEEWSTTLLSIPIGLVQPGNNKVTIIVDENPPGQNAFWWVQIGSGQLLVDGGTLPTASVRSLSTNKPIYSYREMVVITTEVDTSLVDQNIRVESNVLTADLTNIAGTSTTTTIIGDTNDAVQVTVALPEIGDGGPHSVESLVFDEDTGLLHARYSVPIEIRSRCGVFEDLRQPLMISGGQAGWLTSDEELVWEAMANTADSGSLAALPGQLITHVRFWGVNAEWDTKAIIAECLGDLNTPFNFYFYADDGGAPGKLLDSRLDIQASATNTGSCCWNGGLSTYRFDAEFDQAVDTSNVRWISVRRQQGNATPAGNSCLFGWVTEGDTSLYDNSLFQRNINDPTVNVQEGLEHDFLLCVDASLIFRDGLEIK